MKTIFFSFSLIISTALSAQTIDQLKKENEKLKIENQTLYQNNTYLFEKLSYHNTLAGAQNQLKSFDSNFEIKVLSCTGNTNSQEVTLELVYVNKTTNKNLLHFQASSVATDGIGQTYNINLPRMEKLLLTGIETRVVYKIQAIMPGTDTLSAVSISCRANNPNGGAQPQPTLTEIRNIKITWVN
ncbi:MAG: hypothetical protein K9G40_00110 [Crocinitomicaceae bacterium]|nr:hypothetical protein [Crocinitomicaceae bacterium]MCF8433293.1 hypothetical protein [Crocinitomicaceae bacterium]